MANSKTAAKPAPLAEPTLSTHEQVLATRYKQGGRTAYSMVLSPLQLVNMIAQPDPATPNPGNRAINEKHANDFADYYLNQESWVIPGILLRAPSIFQYDPDTHVLSYPKRSAGRIQIIDGQHRILGFHKAASIINARIEEAADQRAKALKVENNDKNSLLVREAERRLAHARQLEDRFASEGMLVDIQVTDSVTASRQMFFDIADNALGISGSVKVRFDTTKAVNRALIPVLAHPLLKNRVDMEKDRLAFNGDYLMTARHVADIIKSVEIGINGRMGKVKEATMNDADIARHATNFLDDIVKAFPQMAQLMADEITPLILRSNSMLGSPAMIRILGGVYHELTELGGKRHWAREEVVAYLQALEPHLYDGAHRNSIWYRIETKNKQGGIEKSFTEGAYSPNGRRQDLEAVVNALTEWAILGKAGAPWVWEAPAAPPAPEKTPEELEDEQVLAAQIEADPDLGKLLEEQLAFEQKAK